MILYSLWHCLRTHTSNGRRNCIICQSLIESNGNIESLETHRIEVVRCNSLDFKSLDFNSLDTIRMLKFVLPKFVCQNSYAKIRNDWHYSGDSQFSDRRPLRYPPNWQPNIRSRLIDQQPSNCKGCLSNESKERRMTKLIQTIAVPKCLSRLPS